MNFNSINIKAAVTMLFEMMGVLWIISFLGPGETASFGQEMVGGIKASDWLRVITWPGYWLLIGETASFGQEMVGGSLIAAEILTDWLWEMLTKWGLMRPRDVNLARQWRSSCVVIVMWTCVDSALSGSSVGTRVTGSLGLAPHHI